jgi:hypothetical protein
MNYKPIHEISTDAIDVIFLSRFHKGIMYYFEKLLSRGIGLNYNNYKQGNVGINLHKNENGIIETYRFGLDISKEEAKQIILTIYDRFPKFKYTEKIAG